MSFEGSIQLIIGPMFSGKSSELLRRVRKYCCAKMRCVVIKYKMDQRYSGHDEVSTHDKIMYNAIPATKLSEIKDKCECADVIGIDEGQFYPDLIDFSEEMANNGKIVIISALDADYKREPFGDVCKIIPKCESVVKLKAVCMFCFEKDASFSFRITKESQTEVIGGSDKYVSCCRKCYNKNIYSNKNKVQSSENLVDLGKTFGREKEKEEKEGKEKRSPTPPKLESIAFSQDL